MVQMELYFPFAKSALFHLMFPVLFACPEQLCSLLAYKGLTFHGENVHVKHEFTQRLSTKLLTISSLHDLSFH